MLELTPEVRAALLDKHPPVQLANLNVLIRDELPAVNPIVFNELTGDVVRKATLATQGAVGLSMGDSYVWRHLLVLFKGASNDLCDTVAGVARHLATEHVDPAGLLPLLNNRLIPLDKDPGVRTIGIGEVLQQITGKSILSILKKDIMQAVEATQVCAGQSAGCEAAIHALRQIFEAIGTNGILLVNANDAFNRLSRAVGLRNISNTPAPCLPPQSFRAPAQSISSCCVQVCVNNVAPFDCTAMPLCWGCLLCCQSLHDKVLSMPEAHKKGMKLRVKNFLYKLNSCKEGPVKSTKTRWG